MKNSLKVGLASLGAIALFGAACGQPTTTNTNTGLGLSVEVQDGDLIQYGTTTFVFSDNTKRGITTAEVFEDCGYKWEDVRLLEKADFEKIPDGEVLSVAQNCP